MSKRPKSIYSVTKQGWQWCNHCKKETWHIPKLGLKTSNKRLCTMCNISNECKMYNFKKWTILGKAQNGDSLKTRVGAETEKDAHKIFLEKHEGYSIVYTRPAKRYSYSVTEEGVLNPIYTGKFCGGRVEVYDDKSSDGYAVYEWRFLMPRQALDGFTEWIEDVETDYPIMIKSEFNMDTLEYEH